MKKINININKLMNVLGQDMIPPSIIKHLRGGHIYAYGSWWDLDIKETRVFKRRKVIRLIRKFNKKFIEVEFDGIKFWSEK